MAKNGKYENGHSPKNTAKEEANRKRKKLIDSMKEAKKLIGNPKITGVDKPNGHSNGQSKELVGPRGGHFKETKQGQKKYDVKKSLMEYLDFLDAKDEFIDEQKKFNGLM